MVITIILLMIPVTLIVTVEAANIPRDVEDAEENSGKISSAEVKAIALAIILFICSFLAFYIYRTCIASVHSCSQTPLYTAPPPAFALPMAAAVASSDRIARHTRHVAFQFSRSRTSASNSTVSIATIPLPDMPSTAYGAKTKVTAPTAGARAPSIRRMPLY